MRSVIQRVTQASVTIDGKIKSEIKKGLLVLVGIEDADTDEDIIWLSNKIVNLRIFDDENKVPNISVKDIGGDILLVSQFTLHAVTKKGNRPSYIKASKPEVAIPLYEKMITQLQTDLGKEIYPLVNIGLCLLYCHCYTNFIHELHELFRIRLFLN